jgi:uncharacterized protein
MARIMWLVTAALMLASCSSSFRDRIYQPAATQQAPVWPEGRRPQTIEVTTADGLRLTGLWWPPRNGQHDVIVYFHGNGGSLLRDAPRALPLAAWGQGLLMTSYRGYSGHAGTPTEAGLRRDATAYVDWAQSQARAHGGQVYLFGHSLGGSLALGEAVRPDIAGVATLGAFARMTDLAPSLVRFAMPDRYDNLALLPRIQVPVRLLHGTMDTIVPFTHAERLIAGANANARLIALEAADHHADMDRVAPAVLRAWNPD